MSTATANLNDATQAVRALEAEFEKHANAGETAALVDAFYAEDAQLLPPHAPLIRGKAAIRDFWSAFMATGISEVSLQTDEVIASGDLAYGMGKYGYSASGARHTGKYVVVYRRQPAGGYKAVADAFNPNE